MAQRRRLATACLTRRAVALGATAALGAAFLPRRLAAQAAPKVFLDYTQDELDRAYDQRAWAPNAAEVIKRYTTVSDAVRSRLPHQTRAYGPSPDETLDIFPATVPNAPIHVFVHGGAWRALTKDDSSFPAETFVAAGVTYIALNFANIPAVRLPEMAEQVRRAIVWTHRNAASFGGDPERIYISGHSSGGHLAAVLLTTDWPRFGAPETVLKGGLCVSGMYDLRPVLLSARSSYVKLSPDEEHALSPQRHLDRVRCPIVVAYGDRESPEFQRHGRDFAAALKSAGHSAESIVGRGMNHFEFIETLAAKDSLLARTALAQIGA